MSERYIFSYFQPLPEMDMASERILVSLWRQNWLKAGLTPIVLTEWHASRHPIYVEFDEAVSRLPSMNPKGYERACYLRWLAVQVAAGNEYHNASGRIVLMDYDVFPYAIDDRWLRQWNILSDYFWRTIAPANVEIPPHDKMFSLHGNCPALVIGRLEQFADVTKWFMDYVPPVGLKHTSDQYLFEQMILAQPDKFKVSMDVVLYGEPGWEKAGAVHFSNSSMVGKTPKYKFIPELR